jgi:hypothetical protein
MLTMKTLNVKTLLKFMEILWGRKTSRVKKKHHITSMTLEVT